MSRGTRPESDFQQNIGKIFAIFLFGFLAAGILLSIFERLGAPAHLVGYSVIAITLAVYAVIAVLARTGSESEYFVAGRDIPPVYNGMATAAEWMSGATFIGLAGMVYLLGHDGLAYLIGMTGGFVLMAVLIVPYLRKLGAYTIPEFFGARYGAFPRLLAVIILAITTFALLVAQMYGLGLIASRFLDIPYEWAVWAGLAMILLSTMLGGMKAVTWSQAAQYAVLLIAYLTPIAFLSMKTFGWPVPQFTYGEALAQITSLETGLIEKGLADARTLKPHVTPFLQLDALNFFGLVFCLMLGVASFPHLLMRYLTTPTVREARTSVAWSAFFVLLLALTIPAYAAFAKLEVYRLIDGGTSFAALPAWVETYSKLDLIKIHGVSLKMLDDTIAAVKAGAGDVAGVAAYLKASARDTAEGYAALKEAVKAGLLEAAKSARDFGGAEKWETFRQTVLPIAAKAAGNKTGMLTQGGLVLEPNAVVLAIPEIAGLPAVISGLTAAGALAAALAAATGLAISIANAIGHDVYHKILDPGAPAGRRLAVSRLILLGVAFAAAYGAARRPTDIISLVTWGFSLAAAGFFPALVLGIWWKRANAWGAAAGMIAGFGLCLYYLVATRYFAADFYGIWSHLSSADAAAAEKFASLKSLWTSAEGDAKAAAWAALDLQARGTAASPGVANWFGVLGVSAAVFAVPLGFALIFVVSLITPRPWPEITALIEEMRRPKGPDVLSDDDEIAAR